MASDTLFKSGTFILQLRELFTFTDYAGMDPETNKLTYPTMRQASFGLNVSF